MSKVPGKGTHGQYGKGGPTANGPPGSNPKVYYNSSSASSSNSTGSGKYTPSPCRYWRQGTCKLGDSCRFLHEGTRPASSTPTSTSSGTYNSGSSSFSGATGGSKPGSFRTALQAGSSSTANDSHYSMSALSLNSSIGSANGAAVETGEGITATNPTDRVGRRPFLKVVVLYASDSRVLRYAKEVQSHFLDSGVDVYLQIELDNVSPVSGINSSSATASLLGGGKDNEIKTENLAEIITSSTNADFLIVIGDRNMKNQSCQVKKRGKLVEMEVSDMIRAIWQEWSPYQADFLTISPTASPSEVIDNLTISQLYIIIQRFPPHVNFDDRLKRAKENMEEVKSFKKSPSSGLASPAGGKTKKPPSIPSIATSIMTGSHPMLDEKQAAKFLAAQKAVIRLHKQAQQTKYSIAELPEARTEETFLIDQEQFGVKVGPDYRPQQALTGQISAKLRSRIFVLLDELQESAENYGAICSEFGAPLWQNHLAQQNSMSGGDGDMSFGSSMELGISSSMSSLPLSSRSIDTPASADSLSPRSSLPVSANEWACTLCTSLNELGLKECKICGHPKAGVTTDDEGAWETIGEKKAKKKREELAALANVVTPVAVPIVSKTTPPLPTTTTVPPKVVVPVVPESKPQPKPKKVLLDPIPGLAAKQAASKTVPKDIPNTTTTTTTVTTPSKPEIKSTSYSSIVSGASSPLSGSVINPSVSTVNPIVNSSTLHHHPYLHEPIPPSPIAHPATGSAAVPLVLPLAAYPPLHSHHDSNSDSRVGHSMDGSGSTTSYHHSSSGANGYGLVMEDLPFAPEAMNGDAYVANLPAASPSALSTLNLSSIPHSAEGTIWGDSYDSQSSFLGDPNNSTAQHRNRFSMWKAVFSEPPVRQPAPMPQRTMKTTAAAWTTTRPPALTSNNSGSNSHANGMNTHNRDYLRTPTKSSSSSMAPHTPTFTSPFKTNQSFIRYPVDQQHDPHLDEYQRAEPKAGVSNPCWVCGEESIMECNLCPKVGLQTLFCSSQHQTLVWKQHVRTCHPPTNPMALYESNFNNQLLSSGNYSDPYRRDIKKPVF